MKKIISILFALCLCMAASAQQHMKLKARGVTHDIEKSKSAGPGGRIFTGTFLGEKATIIVFYNNKSKIVFGAAVELPYQDLESAHLPFVNIYDQLHQKYPDAACEESKGPDGGVNGMAYNIFDKTGTKRIGFILQSLSVPSYGDGCSVCLTYTDIDNFTKSEAINNEDL